MIGRRGFITGLVSLVAAPAIVRVASIMPVKQMIGFDFGLIPIRIEITDGWVIDLSDDYPWRTDCAATIKWLTQNRPILIPDSEFTHVERCG